MKGNLTTRRVPARVVYPRPIDRLGALVHQRTTLTVIRGEATSRAVACVSATVS
jgi:hypothetical protein